MADGKHDSWKLIRDARIWEMASSDRPGVLVISIGKKRICIVRNRAGLFALSSKCPHQGAPLDHASVDEDDRLICPRHRFSFDPASGHSDSGGYFLETYPLEVREGQVYIRLPEKRGFWNW